MYMRYIVCIILISFIKYSKLVTDIGHNKINIKITL